MKITYHYWEQHPQLWVAFQARFESMFDKFTSCKENCRPMVVGPFSGIPCCWDNGVLHLYNRVTGKYCAIDVCADVQDAFTMYSVGSKPCDCPRIPELGE